MIALDTNVLVRLLVVDDEAQARTAERTVTAARRDRTPLYVADVVLCELVWVLRARYRMARAAIADAIEAVLRTELVVVDDVALIDQVVRAYRDGAGDFADYMIRAGAQARGAREVVTFDRALRREEGFRVLGS